VRQVQANLASPPVGQGGLHRLQSAPPPETEQKKGARPKLQQTWGIVMRSALPEEIEEIFHHNLILDSWRLHPYTAAYSMLLGGYDAGDEDISD